MKHLLSFDLEDWFHIICNEEPTANLQAWDTLPPRIEVMTGKLLDFLRARKLHATFFVLGWVAEKYPHLLTTLVQEGHEIACHSHRHRPVWSMTPDEFAADLQQALDAIEKACGIRPTQYRAPGFSIDARALWAFDILAAQGITHDSSVYPGGHSHGGLPHAPQTPFILETTAGPQIKEFPISTLGLLGRRLTFSGGGYFRLLPLPLQRNRFTAFDRAGQPVVTYFHPRDFDTAIPENNLGRLRRFKNNINVGSALEKLGLLADQFSFAPLAEVSAAVDWAKQPRLRPEALRAASARAG